MTGNEPDIDHCMGCWFKTDYFCKTFCGFYAPSGDGKGGGDVEKPGKGTVPQGTAVHPVTTAPETPEGAELVTKETLDRIEELRKISWIDDRVNTTVPEACPHPSFAIVDTGETLEGETAYELRCAHCFETLPFFFYSPMEWTEHMRDFKSPVAASGAEEKRNGVAVAPCCENPEPSAPADTTGDLTAGRRWLQRKETGDKVIYDIIPGSGYKWLAKNFKIGPRIEEPSDDEFHEVR